MITVIARWEMTQLPADVEFQLYRQLRGSFGVNRFIFTPIVETAANLEQYETMEECLAAAKGQRVFLEPTGYNSLHQQPEGDIVYVIGNTAMHNMEHATVAETYRIDTPSGPTKGHLYGSNALAVALALRWGQ